VFQKSASQSLKIGSKNPQMALGESQAAAATQRQVVLRQPLKHKQTGWMCVAAVAFQIDL